MSDKRDLSELLVEALDHIDEMGMPIALDYQTSSGRKSMTVW